MPSILGQAPPMILGYRMETSIAEKFHAMVELGDLNSRMKDFHDIWILARQFEFEGASLALAISKTFESRNKTVPQTISAFTVDFAEMKQIQWQAFRKRFRIAAVPEDFTQVVEFVSHFLKPPVGAISRGIEFTSKWKFPATWF
jgi:hypothetical protein